MEKLAELLSGRPDIAGELVEQWREGPEGEGDGTMMKSENRFKLHRAIKTPRAVLERPKLTWSLAARLMR
jgi:hypothetical protein